MKTVALDFETFYDTKQKYSLRNMTPIEYVLHPLYETIGCAINDGNGLSTFLNPEELKVWLRRLPERTAIISHNALFDHTILAQKFNYVPALMIDTLGMARAWWNGKYKFYSIAKLAEFQGIGVKGDTVGKVDGMNLAAIKAAGLYQAYADYSTNDVDICWRLYNIMMGEGFPPEELLVQDMVLRCAVVPRFMLNKNVLYQHLAEVQAKKKALLERVGVSDDKGGRTTLLSNDQFALILKNLGVDPPMKVSPATGQLTYAFAKTDQEFIALEDHEDEDVQAIVAARMGIKSTQEETRTERFIKISNVTWPGNQQQLMPVPLKYGAAHTHRLGGEWQINLQNLNRKSKLRNALEAPPGFVVVKADSSQVEARGTGWLAGQHNLTAQFANGEDVYSTFASIVFGYTVQKKSHPKERFLGKTAVLGLGYGLGWENFARQVRLKSKLDLGSEIIMSEAEARNVVNTYRTLYSEVKKLWDYLGNSCVPRMTRPDCDFWLGPCHFLYERIELPSGLSLNYRDLKYENNEWSYWAGKFRKKIYGAKLLENIMQALARIVVMDAAKRIRHRTFAIDPAIQLALQAHDELVYLCRTEHAQAVYDITLGEMCRGSSWSAGWPLAAEGQICSSYGG